MVNQLYTQNLSPAQTFKCFTGSRNGLIYINVISELIKTHHRLVNIWSPASVGYNTMQFGKQR